VVAGNTASGTASGIPGRMLTLVIALYASAVIPIVCGVGGYNGVTSAVIGCGVTAFISA
jgi:hypothetical protein